MRPRGLGRGLGALLPTAPERTEDRSAGEGEIGLAALTRPSQASVAPTVSAVDRWLWRDTEPVLPEGPARAADVPRGTSADLRVVPLADESPADEGLGRSEPSVSEETAPLDEPVDVTATAEPAAGEPTPDPEPVTAADPDGSEDGVAGGATYAELNPESIRPNPRQPRQVFDPDALADLVASIHEVGLLQPIVVRPVGDGTYELVMGERRWRAAQAAGLATIPAIVKPTGDDVLLRDALLENIQRVQLNPLEEAAAYGQLLEDFGCTQDELATRLGRSRPQVTNTLRLLKLSPPVQRRVAAGVLSAGHAKALLAVEDHRTQEELASRVVAEGLSVRSVEELVATRSPAGAAGRRPGRPLTAGPAHPEIAERLSDLLETRVTISRTRYRGRIVIDFATDEDLGRLVELIGSHDSADPATGDTDEDG